MTQCKFDDQLATHHGMTADETTDRKSKSIMASDIIIASAVLGACVAVAGGFIGGNIWWAQRNRVVGIDGKAYLGRNDDRLEKKLDKVLENQSKHQK